MKMHLNISIHFHRMNQSTQAHDPPSGSPVLYVLQGTADWTRELSWDKVEQVMGLYLSLQQQGL